MRIGVIGPCGFSGSYLCVELLNRGHEVVGISRSPERLGTHSRYEPRSTDVAKSSIHQLSEAFEGLEVLINGYGPHTAGENALQYRESLNNAAQVLN